VIAHPRLPQIRTCGITAYGSSSNTFASLLSAAVSLTRYQGSVTLSCFSPAVLLLDVSHPSAGSFRASSPTSSVLSTRYDFLPSISPHFVAFAWRYHGFIWLVRYPTGQMQPRRAWSWYPGISGRVSAVETTGSPTFLGNLGCAFALLSDPGRIDMSDHHDTPTRPPLCPQRRLPQMYFRGSITQLQHWLRAPCEAWSASQAGSPQHHARLASGCWSGSTGRDWIPARFQRKVSNSHHVRHPPFPSFRGARTFYLFKKVECPLCHL